MSVIASVFAALGVVAPAEAAVDYFLEVDGVPGESRDAKEAKAIDVLSYSWGAFGVADKKGLASPRLQDLSFTHRVDAASPVLFQRLVQNTVIPSAELIGRKVGDQPIIFLRWCFQDVQVSSISQSGNEGSDSPSENVTLAYGSASEQYTRQNADGSAGGTVFAGWNATQGALITTYPNPCGGV
ncbi:MAG TPA: type VI secretion system tube protein Hcp [Thermoleophilaceae bacterium]